MGILADILKQADLKARKLKQRSFGTSTSLKFPCEKSIGFHVVIEGGAYIHLSRKKKPLGLARGDIALMARGCH